MKTIYAPDTTFGLLSELNSLAQANPVAAYGILCALLFVVALRISKTF